MTEKTAAFPQPTLLPSPADPLGEALHYLRMRSVFYCHSELTAPWGAHLPPMPDCLMFHLVTEGRCWLDARSDENGGGGGRWLLPGDFALVPHGQGHELRSAPGTPAPNLFDLPRECVSEHYEILRTGGGGEGTRIICGAVQFDHPAARHLVSVLPPVIRITAGALQPGGWLPGLLQLMADEARQMRAGGEAVITRLADIVVIQAIRHWVQHDETAQTGWLGALKDPRLGRAMALMHQDPARGWTVAALAQAAAMSRSAFAQRFTERVGMPVLEYLTQWRMHLAQAWLQQGQGIADVAARVGYQSDAAFSRAYRRAVGTTPGAARKAPTVVPMPVAARPSPSASPARPHISGIPNAGAPWGL